MQCGNGERRWLYLLIDVIDLIDDEVEPIDFVKVVDDWFDPIDSCNCETIEICFVVVGDMPLGWVELSFRIGCRKVVFFKATMV